ncbi:MULTISPECIES: hypothetical protein [unclassified Meiothermus]|nr:MULTISPECIES: hypothetical protein [unclassified Meiothermus]
MLPGAPATIARGSAADMAAAFEDGAAIQGGSAVLAEGAGKG